MTTRVGIAALAALCIVFGGCDGEDADDSASTPQAIQEGWPVPDRDSRAQFKLSLRTGSSVDLGDVTFHGARHLSWVTVHVAPDVDGTGLELVRTQGKMAGSTDMEEKGKPRKTMPFPGGALLSVPLFGKGGVPGKTVTRALARTLSGEDEAAAAWTLLGLVPPPPADEDLAAGLTWTADAAWPLFPSCVQRARFEIEAVEAETIRVRATWLGVDLEYGWTGPDADLVVDVSRRDGLALAATLDVTFFSVEDAPEVDGVVSIPVKGMLERIAWTEPPAGAVDVEAIANELADPDPAARAKAARRLGGAWPDAGRVATALVAAMGDEDARVREAAAAALRELAERGVPSILAFLDDDLDADREGYEQAMTSLQMLAGFVTPKNLASAGTASPPTGALGLLSILRFGAAPESTREAVWMLEGMAASPAVFGPDGYETRDRELGTTCAAFLALGSLPPDPNRSAPAGVIDRLASPQFGTRLVAVSMLARWGGAAQEVVEALRGCLEDDERWVAVGARIALERLGHPPEVEYLPSVATLIADLERIDRGVLEGRHHWVEDLIDAFVWMGADAVPAVEAMEALAKRARRVSSAAYGRAVAALVQVTGPTRERRAALIAGLRAHLDPRRIEPWRMRPLLDALAVDADLMDEDQTREIVGLLQRFEDGKGFLDHAGLRRLFFALDGGARGALDAVWIERLTNLPPNAVDLFPPRSEKEHRGPVVPGTERFHAAVRLGAKLQPTLALRHDLIEAAGRYAGSDERVRAALERLVAEGDAWTRTGAARALRRLDAE